MIYSVRYKNEQSFMREWAKDPTIKVEQEGKNVSTQMTYKKSSVPGTKVLFAIKFYDNRMQLALDQTELNKAVKDLEFYLDGKQVTEAPMGTQNHPFWKSDYAYLFIEQGEAKLDDSLPKDKIILAAMRKDDTFYFKGETTKPPVKAIVKWLVTPLDGKSVAVVEEEADSMKAVAHLMTMDFEKQKNILKIMGREVAENTDPEVVKSTLFRMITTDKDLFYGDGVTFLAKFMTLAIGSNDEVNVQALVNDCKKFFDKKGGYYHYGELRLGKNLDEVVSYLKKEVDILHELKRKLEK